MELGIGNGWSQWHEEDRQMNLWWYWPLALAFLAIVLFAIPEYIALRKKDDKTTPTFSFWMYTMGRKWPLWIFIWGVLVGGLAVHFLWHWCPPGSTNVG